MLKRIFDITVSFLGLIVVSPILIPAMFLVWREDKHSPFYIAPRVGLDETIFYMVKLRSMVVNAAATGVDSTSANDSRVTPIGSFIRKYKLDELTQLWNVFRGDMSLVGPRPNIKAETDLYTEEEARLLTMRPGITDLASIVFSDEGEILEDKEDPDLSYNQLIRPWKSRLGLIYVENHSILLDIKLIVLTVIAIVSRAHAIKGVNNVLKDLNAEADVIDVAMRDSELVPHPPPDTATIIVSRR